MSAAIFAFTAFQFLAAESRADWASWFTFSTAAVAAARACSFRATILSCASFCAAAAASSAAFARTESSASCSDRGLTIVFSLVKSVIIHRKLGGRRRDLDLIVERLSQLQCAPDLRGGLVRVPKMGKHLSHGRRSGCHAT